MKIGVYKDIPDSEDWRTDTDNPMINAFREVMAENNKYADEPRVGIFWYDPESDDLFGVYSVIAETEPSYMSEMFGNRTRTCKPLHYAEWQRGVNKGRDPRFKNNYTSVPRGRVFEVEGRGFVVCVGHWFNQYPQVRELILMEFQLPDDTEFVIDSHWDLGRGWSDKHL